MRTSNPTTSFVLYFRFAILSLPLLLVTPTSAQLVQTDEQFIAGGLAWNVDDTILAVATVQGVWLHPLDDLSNPVQLTIFEDPASVFITKGVAALAASPTENKLVLGTSLGGIEVWDIDIATMLYAVQAHEDQVVSTLAWSPDGSMIASLGWDFKLRVWDAVTGSMVNEYDRVTIQNSLSWSPQSDKVAFSENGQIRIWDFQTAEVSHTLGVYNGGNALMWSHNGIDLATAARDRILFWNLNNESLGEIDIQDEGVNIAHPASISLKPGSTIFAVQVARQSRDGDLPDVMQIWDADSRERIHVIEDIERTDTVYTNGVAWSHNGAYLASTSDDGRVYVWDAETFELVSEYSGYRSLAG